MKRTMTEEQKEKLRRGRENSVPKDKVNPNVRGIQVRRKESHEIASRSYSIQNYCRECLGWDRGDSKNLAQAVRDCNVRACWLHPWRCGVPSPEEYS